MWTSRIEASKKPDALYGNIFQTPWLVIHSFTSLGEGSKTTGTETFRGGGGGGGGYPPFPLRKNPWKIGLKTVFFGQKSPFSAKKFPFSETDRPWRGGVPPFSVNFFPLTFRKILVRGGPGGGGGGGYPPNGKFPCLGFLTPPLKVPWIWFLRSGARGPLVEVALCANLDFKWFYLWSICINLAGENRPMRYIMVSHAMACWKKMILTFVSLVCSLFSQFFVVDTDRYCVRAQVMFFLVLIKIGYSFVQCTVCNVHCRQIFTPSHQGHSQDQKQRSSPEWSKLCFLEQ